MPEFIIPQPDASDISDNEGSVTLLPDGRIVIAWFHRDTVAANDRSLAVRVFEADGTPVTGELIIPGLAGSERNPSVVATGNGEFVVAWTNFNAGTNDIYGSSFSLSGGALTAGPIEPISDLASAGDATGGMAAAKLPNGNFIVAWVETGAGSARVVARTFDSDLTPLSGVVQISETTTMSPASVSIDATGSDVSIVWYQNNAQDLFLHTLGYGFTVNANGSIPALTLDDVDVGAQLSAVDHVQLANGDILVIFIGGPVQGGPLDDGDKLSGRIYSADFQTVVKNTFQINETAVPTGASNANVVAFAGGGFGVFWSQIPGGEPDTNDSEAYRRIYDKNYNSVGGQTRLTNDGNDQHLQDAVRTSASGDVVLIWGKPNVDGSRNDYGFTISDLDPNPLVAPSIGTLDGDTAAFTEGGSALLDNGGNLVVVSPAGAIASARIEISDFRPGDTLQATVSGGVTQSYANGVLTLSGNASAAVYQSILRTLAYGFSGDNPTFQGSDTARTINVTVTDIGNGASAPATVTVTVAAVNDAPTVTMPAPITVTEDVATAVTGIVFADADAGSASVTVTLSVPSGTLAATNFGGVTVGGTGTDSLTLTGSIAAINSFIAGSRVTFTTDANATADVTLTASINDGGNSGGSALIDTDTVTLDVSAVNDAPVVTTTGGTTAFTEGQNVASTAVVVDAGLTLSDVDDTAFSSAKVSISSGFVSGQDVLAFTADPVAMGDIELLSYNAGTGMLELSSASGTATRAQWEAALRAVTYTNSSETPNTANRTVSFVVNDGTIDSLAGTKTISVAATNDAPTITMPAPIAVTEDTASPIAGIVLADADAGGASVTVTLSVPSGTLAATDFGGVTVGGTGTDSLTLTGSIADINAFIAGSRVTFTTAADATADVVLTASINDGGNSGGSALTDSTTVTLEVTAVNDAPVLTLPASASFLENTVNATPQLLAPSGVTVADAEGLAAGGSLTVSGLLAEDVVSIRNQGSGAGQIGYDAATGALSFGGTRFATAVAAGGSFTITFDTAVSSVALEALIANLTYANGSDTPTASRTLSLLLNDSVANGAPATIVVGVTAENDSPSDLAGGPFSIAELAADGTVVGTIGVVDADGPAPTFMLSNDAGGRFAIDSASGQITIANGRLLDFEQAASHQITVEVSDGLGAPRVETVTITLTDVASETALGGTGADSFVGGNSDDKLVGYGGSDNLTGGAGNDTLFGGADADTMTGGTGDDLYYVDHGGDRVIELANQGFDRIIATGVSYALPANVESLAIVGSGLTGTGSAGNDALYANGAGNTLIGLAGNDSYVVNASTTRVTETATGGVDMVRANGVSYSLANAANVERLELAGTGLTGSGTSGAETLVSKGSGNTLRGLGGNDSYAINAGDTVVEAAGGGTDLVYASVSHTLAVNVENLILSGKGNLAATGNALANVLTGNNGANQLSGLAGNDRLTGGLGADTLLGGAGNDVFDFNAIAESRVGTGNRDMIGDFAKGQDKIDLATIDANSLLVGNQAFAFLGTASFTGAGQLRSVQEGSGATAKTILWGNVDGNAAADFHIELKGHIALSAGDFVL